MVSFSNNNSTGFNLEDNDACASHYLFHSRNVCKKCGVGGSDLKVIHCGCFLHAVSLIFVGSRHKEKSVSNVTNGGESIPFSRARHAKACLRWFQSIVRRKRTYKTKHSRVTVLGLNLDCLHAHMQITLFVSRLLP